MTLKFLAGQASSDELLWYTVRLFNRDVGCSMSVPADFVTDDVIGVDVRDGMIDKS